MKTGRDIGGGRGDEGVLEDCEENSNIGRRECFWENMEASGSGVDVAMGHRFLNDNAPVVEDLRGRLAETEARLERARAREAELSLRLDEMKRFVAVMEILESYLKRRFREQEEYVTRIFS
ncbi:protein SKIP34 [Tripterygium wilfordii]|uniref:Protein SKIP34 n=1 Tax=Tripterygium wilfordii TaxID=458696 RepID=A0A7J7DLS5_TRIWF|nr:protein SKIP34 [Tripterygium wilfordii]